MKVAKKKAITEEVVIHGYKGFDTDMKCRGFQFEEGKEYDQTGDISCCENGFHGCELPHEVFGYYAPGGSKYHAVEMSGKTDKHGADSKIACSHIKIGAVIDIASIAKMSVSAFFDRFEFTKKIKSSDTNNAGDGGAANAGDGGAANAGDRGAANAGDWGTANAGDRGAASVGKNGVAIAATQGKVKGQIGAVLVLVNRNNDGDVTDFAAKPVDGTTIKADTWYTLKDGEFVEV